MTVPPNEKEGIEFTFIYKTRYEDQPEHTINYTTTAESLPDILVEFEHFLRGAGFIFDGELDIINDEEN